MAGHNIKNYWIFDLSNNNASGARYKVKIQANNHMDDIYLNSLKASSQSEFYFEDKILTLYANPLVTESYNIIISVDVYASGGKTLTSWFRQVTYMPDNSSISHPEYERCDKMSLPNVSHAILRVNPKLTGNIKVVVDSDDNIYIDTFKVSDKLAEDKYRHNNIDYRDYYGKNVMTLFSSIPSNELYKINENCYNIFSVSSDLRTQYYDTYNYGVRTNADKLYSENFSYLAPLKVNEKLPDFFLIFKVPATFSYNITEKMKMDFFMQNGKLVKSFDLREGSHIGTYIRTMQKFAKKKTGDLFVAHDDRNMNLFNGISIDRGVITSSYESVFDSYTAGNQVALNDFYTLGFERNRLISKDILNLEFMFDDNDAEQFEINTYFGLYVKVNTDGNEFCILEKGVLSKPIKTFPDSFNDYGNIIYGVASNDEFVRLNNSIPVEFSKNDSQLERFTCAPLQEKYSLDIKEISHEEHSFITLKFTKPLKNGDHIRFIKTDKRKIYEVIISSSSDFLDKGLSDIRHNIFTVPGGKKYDIERIQMHTGSDDIKTQVDALLVAIKRFGFIVNRISDDEIGVKSESINTIFEKISHLSAFEGEQEEYILSDTEDDESVFVLGSFFPEKSYLDVNEGKWVGTHMAYVYPMHFELIGNRVSFIANFVNISEGTITHNLYGADIKELNSDYLVYKKTDDTYDYIHKIDLTNTRINKTVEKAYTRQSFFIKYIDGSSLTYMNSPLVSRGRISLASPVKLSQCVCSILPIKDYISNIYDSKSSVSFYKYNEIIGTPGEYSLPDFEGNIAMSDDEESFCHYIDKYDDNFDKYDSSLASKHGLVDSSIKLGYFSGLANQNITKSTIALTCPECLKWASVGTDHRGEHMKLMHMAKTFYIPDSSMNGTLGYLSMNDKNGSQYNFSKYIRNSIQTIVGGSNPTSMKSDILYGNSLISDIMDNDDTNCRFSKVYSCGNNSIGFISGGIKFQISSHDDILLNLTDYTNYIATFITVPGFCIEYNRPVDVIIDETKKEIVIIWYSGNDTLDKSMTCMTDTNIVYGMTPIYNKIQDNIIETSKEGRTSRIEDYYVPDYIKAYFNNISDTGKSLIFNFINRIKTYGKIYDITFNTDLPDNNDGINGINPRMHIGNNDNLEILNPTNATIARYTNNYSSSSMVCICDSSTNVGDIEYRKNINDLKDDIKHTTLYIKTETGCKDYTTLEQIITVGIDDPYTITRYDASMQILSQHNVVPSLMEPLMKDMLIFDYAGITDIEDTFNISLTDSNTKIYNINKIDQLWINKVSSEPDFCSYQKNNNKYYKLSIDVLHNISIMDNAWGPGKYRRYYREGNDIDERYEAITGYASGLEPNCYLGSRGVVLKNDKFHDITITSWTNTKAYQKKGFIKFAITDSLINKIRFTPAYISNWSLLNVSDTYKYKYINNTILSLISIVGSLPFELYVDREGSGLEVKDMPNGMIPAGVEKVDNIKHELKYEGGKYFMYVYPETAGDYYARFIINL